MSLLVRCECRFCGQNAQGDSYIWALTVNLMHSAVETAFWCCSAGTTARSHCRCNNLCGRENWVPNNVDTWNGSLTTNAATQEENTQYELAKDGCSAEQGTKKLRCPGVRACQLSLPE
jgi:hypothetical protein